MGVYIQQPPWQQCPEDAQYQLSLLAAISEVSQATRYTAMKYFQ